MKKSVLRPLSILLAIIFSFSFFEIASPISAYAYGKDKPIIVVSMGDSYSSGEGIEPFYGQIDSNGNDLPRSSKIVNNDWLAHRSMYSWPSLLTVGNKAVKDHKMPLNKKDVQWYNKSEQDSELQWYFVASSGAVTSDFIRGQEKTTWDNENGSKTTYLPPQLDVFDKNGLYGKVDYVTMSIGGNDLGFVDICLNGFLDTWKGAFSPNWLKNQIDKSNKAWSDTIRTNLKKAYWDTYRKAGDQVDIIVVGYPELYYRYTNTAMAGLTQRKLIDDLVLTYCQSKEESEDGEGGEIAKLIEEVNKEIREKNPGITRDKIHYVSVITEFKGHGMDAPEGVIGTFKPWINGTTFLGSQKLDEGIGGIIGYSSAHPNKTGAEHYANLVNKKIAELEPIKQAERNKPIIYGRLSGKICKASDRSTPINNADIKIYRGDSFIQSISSGSDGVYNVQLPVGDYRIEITAEGFIPFSCYASVTDDKTTYLETFLLVGKSDAESGKASGTISDSITGKALENVSISVRSGWNNSDQGEVIKTANTNSNGKYSLELPLGYYTLNVSKNGYIPGMVNIIVQEGETFAQNGVMTPIGDENTFRIVLTWGATPSDLDSHMQGTLLNGNTFHVMYNNKRAMDGTTKVCELDVDDTSSYGPETITLNPTTEEAYYYYIYRYSSSGSLINSEAQVKVYKGNNLVRTFNIPLGFNEARYWNIFAIKNGELIVKNSITDSPDLEYTKEDNGGSNNNENEPGEDNPDPVTKENKCTTLYTVVGESETEMVTYNAKDPDNFDSELSSIRYVSNDPAITIDRYSYSKSSNYRNMAYLIIDYTSNKPGTFMLSAESDLDIDLTDLQVVVEPKLGLESNTSGNMYNHYTNYTIDFSNHTGYKDVVINVAIDESNIELLENFLNNSIEVNRMETGNLTAPAIFETSYTIADDGKSATYVIRITCVSSDMDDYLTVKTKAQEKVIHVVS